MGLIFRFYRNPKLASWAVDDVTGESLICEASVDSLVCWQERNGASHR